MRRLAPSKKEIEVDKDIEPDFETELGRFGSLKHYENVFKETHSSLKAALELLEQGV